MGHNTGISRAQYPSGYLHQGCFLSKKNRVENHRGASVSVWSLFPFFRGFGFGARESMVDLVAA